MNIIMIGPPASGKGTQVELLKERLNLSLFAPGNAFREIIDRGGSLGKEVNKYVGKGLLVPEEITTKVLRSCLEFHDSSSGLIFDGYPRTLEQIDILEKELKRRGQKIDVVFFIDVSEEEIKKRVEGRLQCSQCGLTYNQQTKPPKKKGICDTCGSSLAKRGDEGSKALALRLGVYNRQTMPVIEELKKRKMIEEIDGERPIEVIFKDIMSKLKNSDPGSI